MKKLSKTILHDNVYKAALLVLSSGKASPSTLSGHFPIKSFEYIQWLLGELERNNIVGPQYSYSKPRKILISEEDFLKLFESEATDEDQYNAELLKNFEAIDKMDGNEFEHFCSMLLLRNGFYDVVITQFSGDQGVDILAQKDDIRYAIQCKCFQTDLGNTPIQEIYAGKEMYDCHVGVVMTNRFFTPGAKALAQKTRVLLWDRDKLNSLIKSIEA